MTASNLKLILAAALFAVPAAGFAQNPPPNWEMTLPGARQFGKDVCSERDETNDPDDPGEVAACYAAYLRQQVVNREEDRATLFNDAVTACERENRVCIAVVEALAESNGRITPSQLRDIQCRAEEFTAQDISQLPHCDTAAWNPPFQPARRALCQQEIVNVREGLIGTAPLPGEEGISETNPTPACRVHWITLEDICQSADTGPDEIVLVTDEIHPPLECPPEPENTP